MRKLSTPLLRVLLVSFSLPLTLIPLAFAQSSKKPHSVVAPNEFQILRERLKAIYRREDPPGPAVPYIGKWVKTLSADASWPDIDYTATETTDFEPVKAISRTATMAIVYGSGLSGYYIDRGLLRTSILDSYRFWLKSSIRSYNWWNNEIGVQLQVIKILMNLWDEMSEEDRRLGIQKLTETESGLYFGKCVGQNALWYSQILLAKGILLENRTITENAVRMASASMLIGYQDGIQADYSFYQHMKLLYSGGYGQKFSRDVSKIVALLDGTSFAFRKDKTKLLVDHILEGQQWMMRSGNFDFQVTGRELSRPSYSSTPLIQAVEILSKLDVPRAKELGEFYEDLLAKVPSRHLNGNKMFRFGDFMTHHRKDFYASARMFSSRTRNIDPTSNGEGLLSHNLADGATTILLKGDEYKDLFPIWDWNKIPGTTASQTKLRRSNFVPEKASGGEIVANGTFDFAGGVSDGVYGVAAMDFKKDREENHVEAKKAWFFFDQGFWAMGQGVNCFDCDNTVATTLNQMKVTTDTHFGILGDYQIQKIGLNETSQSGLKTDAFGYWVSQGNVGYVIPGRGPGQKTATLRLRQAIQRGSWKSINSNAKDEPVFGKVLGLWIDHGENPINDTYEYGVLPGASDLETLSFMRYSGLHTYNEAGIQAVAFDRESMLQAVFYRSSELSLGDWKVKVDRPCALLIREEDYGRRLKISVSSPEQKAGKITLQIQHRQGQAKSIQIELPSKYPQKGKTVSRTVDWS
jgi:chondroitin AC lyase